MAIEEVNGIFDPRPNASPATRETPKSKGTSAWWVADLSRDFRPLIRLKRRNAGCFRGGRRRCAYSARCKSGTMLRPVEVAKLDRFSSFRSSHRVYLVVAPIGPEDPFVLVAHKLSSDSPSTTLADLFE
jgi:hypothetical protein